MNGTDVPDRVDLELLEILQEDIPLVSRPWDILAARVGISPEEVLCRVERLQAAGIVLSVSPILESRHLGLHAATLVALRVPGERVHEVANIVSSYREVSHNYQRDHPYSIWFTLSAESPEQLARVLRDIHDRTGIADGDILNLPTVQKFKIDLRFSFIPENTPEVPTHGPN
jgi:siroheme decarboxylase